MAALCAGLLGLASARAAATPVTIPLQPYVEGLYTVQLAVNGQTGTFLFDTGEGVSVVSPDFAARLHCEPWGQITGFRFSGDRLDAPHCDQLTFQIGATRLAAPVAGVIDIMSLVGANAPHVDGAVGLDLFAGRAVSIVPHQAIIVETPESLRRRLAHARELPVRLVRDAQGASLTVDGAVTTPKGTAWMELDTGNTSGNLVANHIAPLVGLPADQAQSPVPGRLTLANGIAVEGGFRTGNYIMDGNLGAAFLSRWVLTFDLREGRAWLSPSDAAAGGP
jgi:Aspartyl protease